MRNDVKQAVDNKWQIEQDSTSNQWSPTADRVAAETNVQGRGHDPIAIRRFSEAFQQMVEAKASRLVIGIGEVLTSYRYFPTNADERVLIWRLELTIAEDISHCQLLLVALAHQRGLGLEGSTLNSARDQILLARRHELDLVFANQRSEMTMWDRTITWFKNQIIFVVIAMVVLLIAGLADFIEHAKTIKGTVESAPAPLTPTLSPTSTPTLIPSLSPSPTPSPVPTPALSQTFNITSNGQNGGITAGIVNVGPSPRSISSQQLSSLIQQLRPFSGSRLEIDVNNSTNEVSKFSQQIVEAIQAAGLRPKVVVAGMMIASPPAVNMQIWVRDGDKPPGLASRLIGFFNANNFQIKGYRAPEWPSEQNDLVKLLIGPVSAE